MTRKRNRAGPVRTTRRRTAESCRVRRSSRSPVSRTAERPRWAATTGTAGVGSPAPDALEPPALVDALVDSPVAEPSRAGWPCLAVGVVPDAACVLAAPFGSDAPAAPVGAARGVPDVAAPGDGVVTATVVTGVDTCTVAAAVGAGAVVTAAVTVADTVVDTGAGAGAVTVGVLTVTVGVLTVTVGVLTVAGTETVGVLTVVGTDTVGTDTDGDTAPPARTTLAGVPGTEMSARALPITLAERKPATAVPPRQISSLILMPNSASLSFVISPCSLPAHN
jgi:hypothetical protein